MLGQRYVFDVTCYIINRTIYCQYILPAACDIYTHSHVIIDGWGHI